MSSLLSPKEKEVYDKVVKQLANRGFGLAELLRFWRRLLDGQMMPGFDPRRSLTNDVVRRAIIPESRVGDGGCALATLVVQCTDIRSRKSWSLTTGPMASEVLSLQSSQMLWDGLAIRRF